MVSLMKSIGAEPKLSVKKHGSFIDGRCAAISVDNTEIGIIGEVSPQVIANWGLERPCCGFEIDLDKLFGLKNSPGK